VFDPLTTCERCGRPGAVVIDIMWFPDSPQAFRFTFRLCRWHRAAATRTGEIHCGKFIGPLAPGEMR